MRRRRTLQAHPGFPLVPTHLNVNGLCTMSRTTPLPCSSESSLEHSSPVHSHPHISRTPEGFRPETALALASNPTIL